MIRVVVLLLLLVGGAAQAVQPDERLADPALEARARAISSELRCLVCQNQSIDDSEAPLARDLRLLVRERLAAGGSDDEVRDYLVERYGEFVLLKPRFGGNVVLWLTPLVVLAAGGMLAIALFRRSTIPREPGLSPDEEQAIARILRESD